MGDPAEGGSAFRDLTKIRTDGNSTCHCCSRDRETRSPGTILSTLHQLHCLASCHIQVFVHRRARNARMEFQQCCDCALHCSSSTEGSSAFQSSQGAPVRFARPRTRNLNSEESALLYLTLPTELGKRDWGTARRQRRTMHRQRSSASGTF